MPMTAVRYTWMFRAAAIVALFFGFVWLWRFGFTDYQPALRPYGLAGGVLSLLTGIFLLRQRRFAIVISAIISFVVGFFATVFAPSANGPVILFAAGLAIICVLYAALSLRFLTQAQNRSPS